MVEAMYANFDEKPSQNFITESTASYPVPANVST